MHTPEEKMEKLAKALIALVGTDDSDELDRMEVFIRSTKDVPDRDKTLTINGIDAIRFYKDME